MTLLVDIEAAREKPRWDHSHAATVCLPESLFTITGEVPDGYLESCAVYLAAFAAPIFSDGDKTKAMVCLHCDADLSGFFGSFEWGIAHGEGRCNICGYPARAFHVAKDADGGELFTLRNFILQYLPDFEAEAAERDRERAVA
jgi:hypothetical protein